jgi:peptide subunit release factor 1 (eRF1)
MTTLTAQLEKLARFEPAPYPVISLYLNTQPGQTGRDQYDGFLRKEFKQRGRTYPAGSPERDSLDRDLERITTYLATELQPSANGVAIFACSAAELFETVQLSAPLEEHWLYIGDAPHLYPLARLDSQYPRYAAVVADTNAARIFVVAAGEVESEQQVESFKTRRSSQGGWAQARYQRHIENYHVQHMKEVIDALARIVQQENIAQIVLAGDEVVLPLFREQLPKPLAEKVVDHLKLHIYAPVKDILAASLEAMQRQNQRTDREKVDDAVSAYRAGGLGTVGAEETLAALAKGQVEELLISSRLNALQPVDAEAIRGVSGSESTLLEPAVETSAGGEAAAADPQVVRLADELVTLAKKTSARVTFIEDPELLEEFGGVAALLRFRI